MATKKGDSNAERRAVSDKRDTAPDDFPDELAGELQQLPDQCCKNIGTVAGLALRGGGYFGLSVTDDGGSCRLAVRNGSFVLDKRFYGLAKLEAALAYCVRKLE